MTFTVDLVAVPTTVCYGAEDVMLPAAHGAWLADHIPAARPSWTVNRLSLLIREDQNLH